MSGLHMLSVVGQSTPTTASTHLIYRGSSERFIASLVDECREHPAVSHPYLTRLADGQYRDHRFAVSDYALQYGFYSANFTKALRLVRDRIDSEDERRILDQNLLEEEGNAESDRLADLPHRELFRRFARQVGVSLKYDVTSGVCMTVRTWTRSFLEISSSEPVEVGIGAIGLGTELVVPMIYPKLLYAVDRLEVSDPEEARMFFALHVGADSDHGMAFLRIAEAHATSNESREALRFGALSSLNLRQQFYDVMDARASAEIDQLS